ncbi:hypothetical protein BC832DRAFT_596107 [Gaertneriomyces semiglobifer]|nr:hypothetical protein BC832DRAFT_596107 [Gaertneriomyces semiglobifer]
MTISNVSVLVPPRRPDEYGVGSCGTHYFPVANWAEHKERKKIDRVVYQDLRRHPWKGVAQAPHPFGVFHSIASGVDRDMATGAPLDRLRNPASGNGPVLVARTGERPNAFLGPGSADWQQAVTIKPTPTELMEGVVQPRGQPAPQSVATPAFDPAQGLQPMEVDGIYNSWNQWRHRGRLVGPAAADIASGRSSSMDGDARSRRSSLLSAGSYIVRESPGVVEELTEGIRGMGRGRFM